MKKLFTFLLLATLFLACNNTKTEKVEEAVKIDPANQEVKTELSKYQSKIAAAKLFYQERESNYEFIRLAIINDSDGYTNVRSEPNSKSNILFKLTDEDEFHVINPSKDVSWWIICNEDNYGFVHQSKIEIIDGIW